MKYAASYIYIVQESYGAAVYRVPYRFGRRRWLRARRAYTRALRDLPGARWPRWDALDPFTKAQLALDVGGQNIKQSRTDL